MKFKIQIFLIVLFIFSLTSCVDLEIDESEYVVSEYQLLYSYNPEYDYYAKRHIVDYFKSVALGSEFGDSFPITRKWLSDMKIYLDGEPSQLVAEEVEKVINEINNLSTDGFRMKIVSNSEDANFHIFLGTPEAYFAKYPSQINYTLDNRGLFTISWNSNFEITSGHMYVDIGRTNSEEQKHIVREELTQSIGLPNDIPYYPNSIFYEKWSSSTKYNDQDIEIIRLLYHPKVPPGLSETSTNQVLNSILGLK